MKILSLIFIGVCLLLFCSCSTTSLQTAVVPATDLPVAVTMNHEAGRGGMLIVTLQSEDGMEIPCLMDTGASGTVFDKSLEPKLGKRLGTGPSTGWSGRGSAGLYAAPKLYLGKTPLVTGSRVWTVDLKHPSGILGMDCLKHYCIQLDFEAGKIRFLNPSQLNAAGLGKAFPLTFRGNLPFIHHAGLLGGSDTNLLIDVGCRIDGLAGKNAIKGLAQILPDCIWDGAVYSNVTLAAVDHANVIGLSFLARHLVTLDFPKRIMYLKQIRAGPLAGDEIRAPAEFLEGLEEKDKLPGLSGNDKGAVCVEAYSNFESPAVSVKGVDYTREYFNSGHKSVTFALWKDGDSYIYHYEVIRASKDSPWKLQKAWRTDQSGHIIQNYSVP